MTLLCLFRENNNKTIDRSKPGRLAVDHPNQYKVLACLSVIVEMRAYQLRGNLAGSS